MRGKHWGEGLSGNSQLDWVEPFVPWDGMQYVPLSAAQERFSADAPAEVLALTIDQLVDDIWKPFIRSPTRAPQAYGDLDTAQAITEIDCG